MVPHEVPVANEMRAATTNTATGSKAMGIRSESALDRNDAVPSALVTSPSDHASTRITIAIIMARKPPSQAVIACGRVRIRWVRASRMATVQPSNDPHSNVLNGSAFPRMRDTVAASPSGSAR